MSDKELWNFESLPLKTIYNILDFGVIIQLQLTTNNRIDEKVTIG
jgi:hypothetical protein